MNSNLSNPSNSNEPIDRLLGDYFKSQVPTKWPDPPQSMSSSPATDAERRACRQSQRSRWALAASIAMMIGACWYLSGQIGSGEGKGRRGIRLEDGTAKLPKELVKPAPKVGMP